MKTISVTILFFLMMVLLATASVYSQNSKDAGAITLEDQLINKIHAKSSFLNKKLEAQQNKYLKKLSRDEIKLKNKLAKKDSCAAENIFSNSNLTSSRSTYMPYMDSIHTVFNFARDKQKRLPPNAEKAFSEVKVLQNKFSEAEQINKVLEKRKQALQEQFAKYGMIKELAKYKKGVYYYSKQVKEYRDVFNDPSKIEKKLMTVLQQSSAFNSFFRKHSQLATLFLLPGDGANVDATSNLLGLQSRTEIENQLMQKFGSRELNQQVQQQMKAGKSAISKLKEKAHDLSGNNKQLDMPDFKPNNQKTKRFIDRLETGFNIQSSKNTSILPATSDIGASLGYKLNDNFSTGVGIAYKVGWGADIRHIKVSHEGLGFRSFIEHKMKWNFWMVAGGELNYFSSFKDLSILQDYSEWKQSALLGISKKYKISSKLKGNLQMMYDFLHSKQAPEGPPVVFRLGYTF